MTVIPFATAAEASRQQLRQLDAPLILAGDKHHMATRAGGVLP